MDARKKLNKNSIFHIVGFVFDFSVMSLFSKML